jgi:hypothetical protein
MPPHQIEAVGADRNFAGQTDGQLQFLISPDHGCLGAEAHGALVGAQGAAGAGAEEDNRVFRRLRSNRAVSQVGR